MRTFQDRDFLRWEAYANPGDFGYPGNAQIIFHCLSDPARRARVLQQEGERAEAEKLIMRASEDELTRWLESAEELD